MISRATEENSTTGAVTQNGSIQDVPSDNGSLRLVSAVAPLGDAPEWQAIIEKRGIDTFLSDFFLDTDLSTSS